jgi:hypothetical protein
MKKVFLNENMEESVKSLYKMVIAQCYMKCPFVFDTCKAPDFGQSIHL